MGRGFIGGLFNDDRRFWIMEIPIIK
jgi:hypothetical protein